MRTGLPTPPARTLLVALAAAAAGLSLAAAATTRPPADADAEVMAAKAQAANATAQVRVLLDQRPKAAMQRRRATDAAARSPVFRAAAPALAPAPLAPALGAAERRLSTGLSAVQPSVESGALFALSGNRVCAIGLEEYRASVKLSTDGGSTFAAATVLAGGSGQPPVLSMSAAVTPGGTVIAVFAVAEPNGGVGLRVTRGANCSSFSALQTINLAVSSEVTTADIVAPVVAAGGNNTVAVGYIGAEQFLACVVASSDGGATWKTPYFLDDGGVFDSQQTYSVDVDVDGSGVISAAYTRPPTDGSFALSTVVYARSTDQGTSFTSTDLAVQLPGLGIDEVGDADVAIAKDGSPLVAFTNANFITGTTMNVVRRASNGTFSGPLESSLTERPLFPPQLYPSKINNAVLLLYPEAGVPDPTKSQVRGWISTNAGVNFTSLSDTAEWNNTFVASGIEPSVDAAQAPDGRWSIAWNDPSFEDSPTGEMVLLRAATSTNDWTTWAVALGDVSQRGVSDTAPPSYRRLILDMAGLDKTTDEIAYLFADFRDDNNRSADLWINRFAPADGELQPVDNAVFRLDSDAFGTVAPRMDTPPTIASDRSTTVYVAFASRENATGSFPSVHVATSADGGYTFATATEIGDSDPTTYGDASPVVAASSEGDVYVAYQSQPPFSFPTDLGRQVRFNYSTNFGVTWQAQDIVLDRTSLLPGTTTDEFPGQRIATATGRRVYVALSSWNDTFDQAIELTGYKFADASSQTLGAPFITKTFGIASRINVAPQICVLGTKVLLGWIGQPADPDDSQPFVVSVGSNYGATNGDWSATQRLSAAADDVFVARLVCGATKATAAWVTAGAPSSIVMRTYDGSTWSAPVTVTTPVSGGEDPAGIYTLDLAYSAGDNVVLAFSDVFFDAWSTRSTNGGVTWNAASQLDDAAAGQADAPKVTTDGNGNAWVTWVDYQDSFYGGSLFARRSTDNGATFGSAVRIDTGNPAGVYPIDFATAPGNAAIPGAALIAYGAWRTARHSEPVCTAYDLNDATRATTPLTGDVDRSRTINGFDLARIGRAWGKQCHQAGYDRGADLNRTGAENCTIDGDDIEAMRANFGRTY